MSSTLARLDDPLLIREGRGLATTAVAESLAQQVREVLDQIEAILAGPTEFVAESASPATSGSARPSAWC